MRYLDRLLPLFVFVWMSQPARQLRRAATVTCAFVALIATGPRWANAQVQFGEVHFPVSCHAGVQKKFDLALAMLHAFSFPAAAKTFEAVSREDPDCAMAYWGLAATGVGSLYGGRPGPMALQGELAVQKAKAIGGKTERERDYIASIEAFYRGAGEIDYAARVRAYANALEQLHKRYPEDREAEIFYAYALSALGSVRLPWPGRSPASGRGCTIVAACDSVSGSHLRPIGPLAGLHRYQPRRRSSRRPVLQTPRDGFPCAQLPANRAGCCG
jgi:hypothetical protein